jgi:hypothetical protein
MKESSALINAKEQKQWKRLYRRIDKPVVATEVIAAFDADPALKSACPGLYLRAKETLLRRANRWRRTKALWRLARSISRAITASVRSATVEEKESELWQHFYRRVSSPAIAAEVVQHLDAAPELKSRSSGLYLRARQTLREEGEKQQRRQRLANIVLRVFGSQLATEPLTPATAATTQGEPTGARVSDLVHSNTEFASAYEQFTRKELSVGLPVGEGEVPSKAA